MAVGNKWVRNFNSPVVSVFKVGKTRDIENRYTLYKSFPLPAEEQINKKITNDAKAFVGRLSDGSFYLLPADYFNAVPATSTLIGQYAEPEHTSVPNFWDFDSDFCLENPENINCQQLVQIGYRVNEIEDTLIDDTSNENKKKDQKKKKEKKIKKEPGFFSTFFNNFSFLTNLSAVFIILAFFWKQKKVDATSNFPDSQTSDLNITNISNADESVENNNSTMLTSDVALLDLNLSSEKPLPSPPVEETEEVSIKSNTIYSAEAEEKLNSLEVTDKVLGYGSHGTIVYQGNFEGRKVAIKRLLLDFYDIAHNEVKLLQDSDHHPNVIRYFYKEKTERFMYIALELSPASLYDVIEKQNSLEMSKIRLRLKPSIVLNQIMKGVNFLHSLKIVHRDIKPQNILFSELNEKNLNSHPRLLISDFGLCKKLAEDQSSFHNTNTGGTLGWRASECIQAHQFLTKLNNSNNNNEENNATSDESSSLVTDPTLSNLGIKVSKKIDIFSSGLVFFYVLSLGQHPFGDKFVREINILKGNYKLSSLDIIGEEGVEAKDLIKRMIEKDPKKRPDAESVLMHPYFWTKQQRLSFLQDVSDRFEVEERDPPSANLKILERGSNKVLGSDWYRRIDRILLDDLQKRRSYDGNSLRDLLRALRNKKHHYQDLPEKVRLALGDLPEGFLKYFTSRFPLLFLHVYYVIHNTKKLKEEGIFQPYFKPPENYF
ncbi:bifunctional endoribonuclease/protein kinase ire1 [Clydaea vesicula]|uniref:non-specific serine/threonine protein kinase n=1 Tax=Clydaea vesicula TaxID=447962 RepID=A0AAD5U286_9FUNG|nr:bifunctional endoribonuclease/protein kinase ire1 [Clydaea vesicula]